MRRARILTAVVLLGLLPGCGDKQPQAQPTELDPAARGRGRDLYDRHGCAGCHGGDGRGNGPATGELRKPPGDFRDPAAFARGADVDSIVRVLRAGIPGSPMVSFDHLTDADLKLLARYVLFLRKG